MNKGVSILKVEGPEVLFDWKFAEIIVIDGIKIIGLWFVMQRNKSILFRSVYILIGNEWLFKRALNAKNKFLLALL